MKMQLTSTARAAGLQRPSLPAARPRLTGRPGRIHSSEDGKGSTATQTREEAMIKGGLKPRPEGGAGGGPGDGAAGKGAVEQLKAAASDLPEQEAAQLLSLYKLLVQHPEARIERLNFQVIEALYRGYQTILWRPAELLNGRLAMLGFSLGVAIQLITGQSIYEQQFRNPFWFIGAYVLVLAASQINKQQGSPKEGIEVGPVKFSKTAELINGRAAMMGFVILSYIEYNQEIQKATLFALQRLSQGQGPIGA